MLATATDEHAPPESPVRGFSMARTRRTDATPIYLYDSRFVSTLMSPRAVLNSTAALTAACKEF
jgi:hypothetical protein